MYEYEIRNGITQKDLLALKVPDSQLRAFIRTELNGQLIKQRSSTDVRERKKIRLKKSGEQQLKGLSHVSTYGNG